jgi:hypothetical protein
MVCAAMVADSARSICPDAARAREPLRAPPVMFATETPARASSASASAASVAVYAGGLARFQRGGAQLRFICADDAP